MTANVLEKMVADGLIASRYKLEILALSHDFQEGSAKIKVANGAYSIRIPSHERIHSIFEAMKNELKLANSMRERLSKLVDKIYGIRAHSQ